MLGICDMRIFLLACGAIFFWGISPLFEKAAFKEKPDPIVLLSYRTAFVIAFLAAGLLITGKVGALRETFNLKAFLLVGAGGLSAGCLAMIFYYHGFERTHLQTYVPLLSLYPVVTFFAVMVFFPSEAPSLDMRGILLRLLGTLLIAGGIFLVTYTYTDEHALKQPAHNHEMTSGDNSEGNSMDVR